MRPGNHKFTTIFSLFAQQYKRPLKLTGVRSRCKLSAVGALLTAALATISNTAASLAQSAAYEPYSQSYMAGATIANAGGTELMCLVPHKGKLFAGVGYWLDTQSYPGSQILVLDGPRCTWRVEHTFAAVLPGTTTPQHGRVSALQEVTFRHDGQGHTLASPVSMLLAGNDDCNTHQREQLEIFGRDDDTGKWTKMTLPNISGKGIRSFGEYHDPTSGADYVFAGTYSNGFVRGIYSPDSPGKIRWDKVPERANPPVHNARVMSYGELDQTLYASAKPYIYQYKYDASGQPVWEKKAEYLDDGFSDTSGVRGLTRIPGNKLMGVLEARGSESKVLDFFPRVEELNICQFLQSKLGTDFLVSGATNGPGTAVHGAYNNCTEVVDPKTGGTRWLVGLGFSELRQCTIPGKEQSAWFLSRNAAGVWNLHEVPSLNFSSTQKCPPAIRCMAVSPFPEDQGQALYIGFYDALKHPCHNTAHIFRVGLATALRPYSAATSSGIAIGSH